MILKLTLANIFSFKNETSILFAASKSPVSASHVVRGKRRTDFPLLKSSIFYGANASGKSNIVKALSFLQTIALGEWRSVLYQPYNLMENNNAPCKIEVEFMKNDNFYAYGVEFSKKGIEEEWLYKINKDNEDGDLVFERNWETEGYVSSFSKDISKKENSQIISFVSQTCKREKSFVADCSERNVKNISEQKDVFDWFKKLHIITPDTHKYQDIQRRSEKDDKYHDIFVDILEYFNTGISDIKNVPIAINQVELPNNLIERFKEEASKQEDDTIVVEVSSGRHIYRFDKDGVYESKAIHRLDGKEFVFDFAQESDGTMRLLDFIPMLIDLQLQDSVYVVDEIDRSMHTLMTIEILRYYCRNLEKSDTKSQLICTTHESHILGENIFRDDEVWFVEKDNKQESHVYSLFDFKPRENKDKGYLEGKYGAIPFYANLKTKEV